MNYGTSPDCHQSLFCLKVPEEGRKTSQCASVTVSVTFKKPQTASSAGVGRRAKRDFADRPIELLRHLSAGLQKCCMRTLQSLFSLVFPPPRYLRLTASHFQAHTLVSAHTTASHRAFVRLVSRHLDITHKHAQKSACSVRNWRIDWWKTFPCDACGWFKIFAWFELTHVCKCVRSFCTNEKLIGDKLFSSYKQQHYLDQNGSPLWRRLWSSKFLQSWLFTWHLHLVMPCTRHAVSFWDTVHGTKNRKFKSCPFIPLFGFYSEQEFTRMALFYLIFIFRYRSFSYSGKLYFLLLVAKDSGTLRNYFI